VNGSPFVNGSRSRNMHAWLGSGRCRWAWVGSRPGELQMINDFASAVVAVLDTGVGAHPWLDGIVRTGARCSACHTGIPDPDHRSRTYRAVDDPLFGAARIPTQATERHRGLIRQTCPDADISRSGYIGQRPVRLPK